MWFYQKCKEPKGRSSRIRKDHKKGSFFTITLYLLLCLYLQLVIFRNYEQRLSGARPLNASAFPCPTVWVHHALHPKKLTIPRNSLTEKLKYRDPEGKSVSLSLRDLGPITTTHHSLPEDYETCLHHCQHPPAWKHCIPTCHRVLRSPRTCFWLESGQCSQGFLPAGQATLKYASTNLSLSQAMG